MGRKFIEERRKDPYYRAAQSQGLRSRAAFKLEFLASRYPIFHDAHRVLDLGAAPGGWAITARDLLGPRGEVVAVDVRRIEPLDRVRVVRGRVGDPELISRLSDGPFDVVLSDMAPTISGSYSTDHARSVELARQAFELARRLLRAGGVLVAKVFDGDLLPDLEDELRPFFARLVRSKPPASRSASSELFLMGFGFRPSPTRERSSE